MTRHKRGEIDGWLKAGARRFLTWGAVASLLCVLTPAMARAAGIEADTGLLLNAQSQNPAPFRCHEYYPSRRAT